MGLLVEAPVEALVEAGVRATRADAAAWLIQIRRLREDAALIAPVSRRRARDLGTRAVDWTDRITVER